MYQSILVPVAIEQNQKQSSIKALNIAQSLCDQGGKITLLHVTEPLRAEVSQYIPDDVLESNRKTLLTELRELAASVENARTEIMPGSPGTVITDYAEQHDTDLIVLASHRPGLRDYFLGSTAARVVRHAVCSVHVLR